MRNDDSPQIPATRHHRRLMTGLCQASHLTESKLSLQKADGLVMETVSHLPTVQPCPVPSEPLFSDVTRTTLAIGQDVTSLKRGSLGTGQGWTVGRCDTVSMTN